MKLPTTPDDGFYREVLRGIGAPITDNTMSLIYAWRQSEGGQAAYNPFNTVHKMPGSTLYRKNPHGVQNYVTPQDGVRATISAMTHKRYDAIMTLLRADAPAEEVAKAIIASSWGTSDTILKVLRMYARGKVVVAPISVPTGGVPASSVEPPTPSAAAASTQLTKAERQPSRALTAIKWGIAACFAGIGITLILRQRALRKKQQEAAKWPSSTSL